MSHAAGLTFIPNNGKIDNTTKGNTMKYAVLIISDLDNVSSVSAMFEQGQSYGLFDTFEQADQWAEENAFDRDSFIYPIGVVNG